MLTVCIIGIFILLGIFIMVYMNHNRNIEDITRYSINIQASIGSEVKTIIDDLFNDCYDDYFIMEMVKHNQMYITDDIESKMRNDLAKMVGDRLSPMAIDKLSLFYNKENLDKILADKLYIFITNKVVENNSIINDIDKK